MSKLTVEVSDEMNQVLADMARERQVPKTQVLRRAVGLMRFLDEASADDEIVLRNRETKQERQLVLETQL